MFGGLANSPIDLALQLRDSSRNIVMPEDVSNIDVIVSRERYSQNIGMQIPCVRLSISFPTQGATEHAEGSISLLRI